MVFYCYYRHDHFYPLVRRELCSWGKFPSKWGAKGLLYSSHMIEYCYFWWLASPQATNQHQACQMGVGKLPSSKNSQSRGQTLVFVGGLSMFFTMLSEATIHPSHLHRWQKNIPETLGGSACQVTPRIGWLAHLAGVRENVDTPGCRWKWFMDIHGSLQGD